MSLVQKTIKSTVQIRDKEKAKQKKLSELMQRQPDDGRNIVSQKAFLQVFDNPQEIH
jgi:hypothetical protein